MANRRFTSQFSYSFERQPVRLMGKFAQSGSTGSFAVLVSQGVTYTAVKMGSAGNSISITITGGATAGAEVVSVSGNAISVQIESGVSSITQVRTAVNASTAAAALVAATGTSASAVSTHALQNLATGTDTSFSSTCAGGMSIQQIGTGVFQLNISDPYAALLGANISLQRASAVDLISQIQSVSLSALDGSNKIKFRMQAAATPTNLVSGDILYICLDLRNSANPS